MVSPLRNDLEKKSLNHHQEHVWSNDWISPHLIIRFPQVRKTFEKGSLQELADDIAKKGIIQPTMVAKLSEENFAQYVDVFERISRTKLLRSNFFHERSSTGETWYYVLVAGERRYRAHIILQESGCTECNLLAQKEERVLVPGECFSKHFPAGLMEVRIGVNINPEEAKSVQFRENNHVRPPVHEEAYAYRDYYDHLKTLNPKLSFKEFAAEVGVSIEKVRRAIWFCELPPRLREAVEYKMISYSNALELKRILQDESLNDKRKIRMIESEVDYLLINPKIKNEDYKKRVSSIIASSQNTTLFDPTPFEINKKGKRKVVEANLVIKMALMEVYSKKVGMLQSFGVIGKGNIYSGISPTKHIRKIVMELQKIVPTFNLSEDQIKTLFVNLDK